MPNELIDVTVQLHHETEKAILVSDDGNEKKAKWLPKSLVEYVRVGKVWEVTMPTWLAEKHGFI